MSKTITIIADLNPTQRTPGIPGWTSPVGESPAETAERERRAKSAARRASENHAEWQRKHEAWLQENAERQAAAKKSLVDAGIERYRAEKRGACLAVGMSEREFEAEWPQMLRAAQLQAAESGGREVERLRASGRYSM